MGIVRSKKRSAELISLEIDDDIVLTSTGAVNIHIPLIVNHVDFFPSSFKLEVGKGVIYIDPLIVDEDKKADYILITHSHQDHFSIPDIKKLLKDETIVICPKRVYKKLTKVLRGYIIKETKPGEIMEFQSLSIESIAAYNMKSGIITPHSKAKMDTGYIISIGDVRIYHTGDTDYIPEMNSLSNITAVLTPIEGDNLTMSTESAADLINYLRPQFAIPMHYSIGTDEVEKFVGLINDSTKVIVMDGQKRESH